MTAAQHKNTGNEEQKNNAFLHVPALEIASSLFAFQNKSYSMAMGMLGFLLE